MLESNSGLSVRALRCASIASDLAIWHQEEHCEHPSFLFCWVYETYTHSVAKRRASPPVIASPFDEKVTCEQKTRVPRGDSRRQSEDMVELLHSLKNWEDDVSDQIDDTAFGFSQTALYDRTCKMSDPARYVDSQLHAYVTLSITGTFRDSGVCLGDFVTVANPRTGHLVHAIIGDSREIRGAEPSVMLARLVSLNPGEPILYLVHPRSGFGQGVIPTFSDIQLAGEKLFREPSWQTAESWSDILTDLQS